MKTILKRIYNFFFGATDKDCVNCVYGTNTGEWCHFNCRNGDKFVNKHILSENDYKYYEIDH